MWKKYFYLKDQSHIEYLKIVTKEKSKVDSGYQRVRNLKGLVPYENLKIGKRHENIMDNGIVP